jgi:hypothetical protein
MVDIHLYCDLDNIFYEYNLTQKQTEKNIDLLQENVDKNTSLKKYGLDSMYGGYFCPSLVMDKITAGFKKGRLLNNIPKGKDTYSVYEIDRDNKLLRIQSIENNELSFEHYIIKTTDIEYCVGTLNKRKCPFIYSTRSLYSNRKIKQFDIINSNDSLWSERYEYRKDKIICKQYYYVPKLEGSDKSIPIGEEGCPIKLYIINITTDKKNEINWLEHGEYINGALEIDYEYKK